MSEKYNITPENIKDYMNCYESDFPLKIEDKAGLDFKDEKSKAILADTCIYSKKSKKRSVVLEISSFSGISWGAVHYYGKLIADGIEFQMLDRPNCTTSNFEARELNPLHQWRYEFDLCRPMTQEEIDNDPDRWYGYYPGTFTSSFETKEEIIALAKECFKFRFVGEWELWVNDYTKANDCIYQVEL